MKPIVLYTFDTRYGTPYVELNKRSYVRALNHPRLGNCDVHTSLVQRMDLDGTFETLNTIYKPDRRSE